ncbi:peptidylprolyl isomerase [Amycolatopsis anabasis]|uniref:peptidylprolyl isomerase n=1 Tax=Amycolatopsis anabasis TaxID=1840409 RepID=UPI00131B7F17|nr:peptidylprolyl isomerase [Amycolatopsis anabasis]
MSSERQTRGLDHSRPEQQRRPAGVPARVRRGISVVAAAAALTVVAGEAAAATARGSQPSPEPGCTAPSGKQPNGKQWPAEPPMVIDPGAKYTARLRSTCGTVTIKLDAARAPRTVNSFVFLANEQYFDHTECHRLTTEIIFLLQCGDPTGTGSGGPGYRFPDENLAGATYPAGTVAMASTGPDTSGSQFFLVYQDSPLPPKYTPFGHVTGGLNVLRNIAAHGTRDGSDDGAPAAEVVLNSVTTAQS